MYREKSLSRDGVCLYEPGADWHTDVGSRLTWAERIEAALADDSFVVYAQPILDLTNKTVSSYELLIRLRDEDGTILPPGMFLHHAERAGLIRDIDRWMVVRAINIIAEQLRHGRQVRLDVNVSAKAFTDPQILPAVREALADTGIPPALLGIEITETAAATDLVRAQTFIESLRTLGCRFSLDDFGAGFSSFYYLKHLAVDTLKIDGSFVKDLPRSAEDQHLVKAIIELARGLDMDSVAEFVEDEETFSMLGEYGATRAQGYHLGIPGPVEEVLAGSWSEALTRGADAGSSDVPPDQAVVER
jgi:EAL domain-containing protein (putative c-di-GMP-specific phosphodiesterase class I)